MENGGVNNIQTLHMDENDTARNKNDCSFITSEPNTFGLFESKCLITNQKCVSSSHCENYTTKASKALEVFDKLYTGHDSRNCEFIEIKGRFPTCTKDFPHAVCYGNGHPSCIKNPNYKPFNYNEYLKKEKTKKIDYLDTITLERRESNKIHQLVIPNLPVKLPNHELVEKLIGKKVCDTVEYDNYTWEIVNIKKSEKQKAFEVHKKGSEKEKTIICRKCKKEILAKDLITHLKTEHPKKKKTVNEVEERKIMDRIISRYSK